MLLSSVMESGHHAVINATNPALRAGDGAPVPQETLNVRRTVLVADRLYYRVRVRNFHSRAVATTIELSLGADFADVFEVRGVDRLTSGSVVAPTRNGDDVRFAYLAADGEQRATVVELTPSPARAQLDEASVRLAWDVELDVGEAISLLITVEPAHDKRLPVAPGVQQVTAQLEAADGDWVSRCARTTTDNELFDRFIDASVRDLHALMMPSNGGELPAAGIPWYVAPFGVIRC